MPHTTKITDSKEILHDSDYKAIAVRINPETSGAKDEVLPAGTILKLSAGQDQLTDGAKVEATTTASEAVGILMHDVHLPINQQTSLVYAGTIRSSAVEGYTDELKAVLPRIQFVK